MALTADEKKLLDELTEKSKTEDPDEDFEIEVYDTAKGRGARVPFRQGKKWLFENLGLGDDPNPKPEGEGKEGDGKDKKVGYFGRQPGQSTQKPEGKTG
jgi:hypothetical protein